MKEIVGWAFYACERLQKIKLPKTLEKVGEKAFAECKALESVAVPSGIDLAFDAFPSWA